MTLNLSQLFCDRAIFRNFSQFFWSIFRLNFFNKKTKRQKSLIFLEFFEELVNQKLLENEGKKFEGFFSRKKASKKSKCHQIFERREVLRVEFFSGRSRRVWVLMKTLQAATWLGKQDTNERSHKL
jgi:hypothetical protein